MADRDYYNDVTPQLPIRVKGQMGPTISAMKSALVTFSSTTYSAAQTQLMTENDLAYACKLNGLSVTGL